MKKLILFTFLILFYSTIVFTQTSAQDDIPGIANQQTEDSLPHYDDNGNLIELNEQPADTADAYLFMILKMQEINQPYGTEPFEIQDPVIYISTPATPVRKPL